MTDSAKQVTTKSLLIGEICTKTGISKKDVEAVYEAFIEATKSALTGGAQVNLPGFGILAVSERSARKGRNPATGEVIDIKASRSVRFKMSSLLKKLLNN